jgi:hypothetical protein
MATMKKLAKTCIVGLLIVLFSASLGHSQSLLSSGGDITINLLNPKTKAVVFTLESGFERILITPSGNFLRTLTFKIEPDHPIMNFPGPIRILEVKMTYDIDGDGEQETITDTMAVLTRSGNLKFVFHSNGAGKRLPRGWDF